MVEEEEEGEEEEEKINPSSQKLISNPETLSKLASMSRPGYLKNNKCNFQQQFSSIPPPLPPPNSAFNSDTPPPLPPPNSSTPPPLPPPNPKSPTRLQLASNNSPLHSKPTKSKSKHFLHLKKFKQPTSSKSVTTKYNNYTSRSNQSSPIKKSTNQSISPTKKSTLRSNSLKELEPGLYTQEWYKQDFFKKTSSRNGVTLEITGTILFSTVKPLILISNNLIFNQEKLNKCKFPLTGCLQKICNFYLQNLCNSYPYVKGFPKS